MRSLSSLLSGCALLAVAAAHPTANATVLALQNGCARGSYQTAFSGTALTIIFSNFIAEAGGNSDPSKKQMSCNIDIEMAISGQISGVENVIYRGYADLDRNVRAHLQSAYRWGGNGNAQISVQETINGPIHDDFLKEKHAPSARPWQRPSSQKENRLRINTVVSMQANGGNGAAGAVHVDTIDVKFRR